MDKRENSWVYRHKFLLGCVSALVMAFTQRAYSHKEATSAALLCQRPSTFMGELASTLPDTRYLFSETYGWFDSSHFNTGQPRQILQDMHMIAGGGGGIVIVDQGVRDGMMGYTAVYRISPHLREADAAAAALGIYLDWSVRFEEWQGQPPRGLVGPLTPFAVEDLPSQYLGFLAQAHNTSVEQLFACYLGPVSGSEDGPPDFMIPDSPKDGDDWEGITRVQNRIFKPFVETETGWHYIDWPESLRMAAISSGPDTWQFVSEETWYLGDDDWDSQVATAPVSANQLRYVK